MSSQQQVIYENGKIFTADPMQPYAEAMVVENGKIQWIGSQTDSEHVEGQRVDLKGQRVIPGIVDAHLHPVYLASAAKEIPCTAPVVNSIADLQNEIRKQRELQKPGEWIRGWGYDEGKLADGRSPVREDLDEAVSDSPVIITRTCAHIIVVNSKALEVAGITKDTPNPPGGQIDRDENGEPTGTFRESARFLVMNKMPQMPGAGHAEAVAEITPFLFEHGITSITEMMALASPMDYLDMYKEARSNGFAQRISIYYTFEELLKIQRLSKETTDRTQPVYIGGIKLFADGSVSGRTAWVNPEFLGADESYGLSTISKEELLAAAAMAKEYGVQLAVHAMGEQAIDQIVDVFAGVDNWIEDGPSVRIEHAALPTPHAIRVAAKKGIAFVPQPIFLFAEIESYVNNLGTERTKTAYPVKSMLEAGISVGFSSDAPATAWTDPVDPFIAIQAAVTRSSYNGADNGQDERISAEKAVELYTRGAAEVARFLEVGQLKIGYFADFLVLDRDIFDVAPEEIGEVKVEQTYSNGQLVYQKKGNAVLSN
ncbi:amidohydrolase [Planococcus sp. 1R117A]|uniref:amidohydrolase n=1 Tax=Planococcus sp. 1R117A TaxID=3447020 RepID=UPI003EDC90AD